MPCHQDIILRMLHYNNLFHLDNYWYKCLPLKNNHQHKKYSFKLLILNNPCMHHCIPNKNYYLACNSAQGTRQYINRYRQSKNPIYIGCRLHLVPMKSKPCRKMKLPKHTHSMVLMNLHYQLQFRNCIKKMDPKEHLLMN